MTVISVSESGPHCVRRACELARRRPGGRGCGLRKWPLLHPAGTACVACLGPCCGRAQGPPRQGVHPPARGRVAGAPCTSSPSSEPRGCRHVPTSCPGAPGSPSAGPPPSLHREALERPLCSVDQGLGSGPAVLSPRPTGTPDGLRDPEQSWGPSTPSGSEYPRTHERPSPGPGMGSPARTQRHPPGRGLGLSTRPTRPRLGGVTAPVTRCPGAPGLDPSQDSAGQTMRDAETEAWGGLRDSPPGPWQHPHPVQVRAGWGLRGPQAQGQSLFPCSHRDHIPPSCTRAAWGQRGQRTSLACPRSQTRLSLGEGEGPSLPPGPPARSPQSGQPPQAPQHSPDPRSGNNPVSPKQAGPWGAAGRDLPACSLLKALCLGMI